MPPAQAPKFNKMPLPPAARLNPDSGRGNFLLTQGWRAGKVHNIRFFADLDVK